MLLPHFLVFPTMFLKQQIAMLYHKRMLMPMVLGILIYSLHLNSMMLLLLIILLIRKQLLVKLELLFLIEFSLCTMQSIQQQLCLDNWLLELPYQVLIKDLQSKVCAQIIITSQLRKLFQRLQHIHQYCESHLKEFLVQ